MNSIATDPWFKPKKYGYGNVPINWEGWAVTIAFALFIVGVVIAVESGALSAMFGLVTAFVATAIFIPFIKAKTLGEWRWRWGDRD